MRRWVAFRLLAASDHLHALADAFHDAFVRLINSPVSPVPANGRSSHARSLSERPTYHAKVAK